jgi:cysteine desulfurase
MEVNGPDPESDRAAPHILNFSPSGVGGEVLVHALEAEGVYVGTGSACSSKTRTLSEGFRSMGVSRERAERAIRLSLSPFTTDDEIERAAEAIVKCHRALYPYRKNVRIK